MCRCDEDGGDARHHDQQRDQELEEGGQHDALLGFVDVLGGEAALDDVLVEAPVAEVGHPHAAEDHRQARQVLVERIVGVEDHVEVVVRHLVRAAAEAVQCAERADIARNVGQGDEQDHQSAEHQHRHLHHVGQRDGLEAAVQRIGAGERRQHDEALLLRQAGHRGERGGAQPEDRGQVDEDVERQPEDRHHELDVRPVPALEELRHGVDFVLQEHRQEKHGPARVP